jgi:hypothetical protein
MAGNFFCQNPYPGTGSDGMEVLISTGIQAGPSVISVVTTAASSEVGKKFKFETGIQQGIFYDKC